MRSTLITLSIAVLALPFAHAQSLSDYQINTIKNSFNYAQPLLQSWGIGTYAEALLELDTPSWSTLTPGIKLSSFYSSSPDSLNEVLALFYAEAAQSQIRWLCNNISQTSADGAVSHRPDQPQL